MGKDKKGMLLDLKLTIEVTNDGKNNNLSVPINKDVKFIEVMTALEMAQSMFNSVMMSYFEKTGKKYTEKEAQKLLYSLSLDEIWEFVKGKEEPA